MSAGLIPPVPVTGLFPVRSFGGSPPGSWNLIHMAGAAVLLEMGDRACLDSNFSNPRVFHEPLGQRVGADIRIDGISMQADGPCELGGAETVHGPAALHDIAAVALWYGERGSPERAVAIVRDSPGNGGFETAARAADGTV